MLATISQINTNFPDGTYGVGTQIPIVIDFDQAVTVTGPATLFLNSGSGFNPVTGIGSSNGVAYWTSSSFDGRSHTFLYTVRAGDTSPDLDVFSSNTLGDTLVNGTFRDGSGTFTPVLPVVPQTTRLSFLKDIVIDTSAPVVPTVTPTRINPNIALTDPKYLLAHPDYFTIRGTAGTTALPAGQVLTVLANGATYTPTVAADGTWKVDLQNDPYTGTKNPWSTTDKQTYDVVAKVTNQAGTVSSDALLNEITIDMTRPSIFGLVTTQAPGSYKVGDTVRFSVIFDEPMALSDAATGLPVNVPYIKMSNGARAVLESVTDRRLNFAYTIKVGDTEIPNLDLDGEHLIWLNGQRIQDIAANQPSDLNGAGTALTIPPYLALPTGLKVDATLPAVVAVRGLAPDGWYGPGQTIVLQVEFSEPVVVTGSLELALNSGASAKATMIPPLTAPGTPTKTLNFTYTVTQGDSTTSFANPNGILATTSVGGLAFTGGVGSVLDLAGNASNLTLPYVTFTATGGGLGSAYRITSSPVVTSVTSPNLNGTYTAGDQITIIVQFDRPIAVTTLPTAGPNPVVPSLQLNDLPTAPHATYDALTHSASDKAAGRFILTYTVAAGEFTPTGVDLDYLSTTSLQSGGYAITHRDALQVNAVLTLPAPGTSSIGSLDYNKNIRIVLDTLAPLAPTLTMADGTGLSPSDNITFNPTVDVTGLEPLSTWQYSFDGGTTWSPAVRTAASTSFLLPRGVYAPGDVQVRQTDASGNTGPAGVNGSTWNVDQTAPTGVTATYVDTGSSAVDGITSNPSVTVAGLEVGAQVEFSVDAGQTWNKAPGATFNLPAATYAAGVILVRAVDIAGNAGAPFAVNPTTPLTIDTSAAALIVSLFNDTGVSATDDVTADPTLAFANQEPGATVEYFDGTSWSTTYAPNEGANLVTVRQLDVAGNASPSSKFSFTLDRTAPLAVTVSLALDTGVSVIDNVTSNPTLNVQGQEAGATLEYSVNGGAWSNGYAPADGVVTVQVRQRDLVGNVSPASVPLTFTLDRTAPTAPTVALANDTGFSGADRITSDGRLVLGGVDPGATVYYSVNGAAYSTAYSPVEGSNTVLVKQLDVAGNESSARTFVFLLDTVAPAIPVVSLQSDTGSSASDRVTSVGTLLISNREANSVVEYSLDGISWTQGFTPIEGLNAVWIRQTDLAGNGSSPASLFTFTLDRVAPTAPAAFLVNDTGSSPSDKVTRDGTIGVIANETPVDVSYSVTNGIVWVIGQPTPIQGVNNVLVRVTDLAGNNSPSSPFSYTFDTVAPPAPIVSLLNDTGLSASDNVTTDPRLNVTGLVTGGFAEYSLDGASWSLVQPAATEGLNTVLVRQTDPAGNISAWTSFSFTLASALPPAVGVTLTVDTNIVGDLVTSNPALSITNVVPGGVVQYSTNGVTYSTTLSVVQGTNTVLVRQMNAAGAVSLPTAFTFVLDSVQPGAPGVTLRNDTGTSPTDRITTDPTLVTSSIEAGAVLSYSVNGGLSWSPNYTLSAGLNTILVRQMDVAGNYSAASSITFNYDTAAPGAPGVVLQNDTGWSSSDRVTSIPTLVLTGLEANASVSYSTNGGASWSGTFLPVEGVNTVLVRQTDAAGNASSPSTSFTFTLDVTNPTVSNVTSPNANGTYTPGQVITIVVSLSETVVLTVGTSATLALNTGRSAIMTTPAGTPTTNLTFSYTVQNGDSSADLDYTSSGALAVTSGSIRDIAGNDLIPTLPAPVTAGGFKALGAAVKALGSSLGTNKNIVISSRLVVTPGVGSSSASLAPTVNSAVTSIPLQFNVPVSTLSLANFRLLLNNRVQSLKGASIVGSGTSWTLRLPSVATNLKGIYTLEIFGVVATNGVGMGGTKTSTYWWRR